MRKWRGTFMPIVRLGWIPWGVLALLSACAFVFHQNEWIQVGHTTREDVIESYGERGLVMAVEVPGYQNDGDNEITGFHVSDGDPTINGLLGAKLPLGLFGNWRAFYTAQHGDNRTVEILPAPGGISRFAD